MNLPDMSSLTASEYQIGDARFFFAKLPALEAWDLLERIRFEFGKVSVEASSPLDSDGSGASLLQTVLSLNPMFVRSVRDKLFEHVSFTNRYASDPQPLHGAEDTAFAGLEPVAVYEVLARALAVNFIESFQRLGSLLPDARPTMSLLDPSASTLSSEQS